MASLMNVDEAVSRILEPIQPLSVEQVTLLDALGRVLAETVTSPLDLPPFANSAVDGYAVRAADVQRTPAKLNVSMDIPAGRAPERALGPGEAARIMTGAPVPEGADAIVMVEHTDSIWRAGDDNSLAPEVVIYEAVSAGANLRPAGENIRSGAVIIQAGQVLRPQDIGMLATAGIARIAVYRQPRAAIITTGDELAAPGTPLKPGQIYDANTYTLAGLVREAGGVPLLLPAASDRLEDVRRLFYDGLSLAPDLLISSAGVSVGAADYVRAVLEELGQVDFWRINLRPGKPLAYGQLQGRPFFGLPGNPVSAMITFEVIVRPALRKMLGMAANPETILATTAEELKSDGRRSYIRVKLSRVEGQLTATMTGTQSSGALMSMVLADGLLVIPEGVTHVSAGTELPVRLLRHDQ
jgi:molybdopterin molybdotransferase